MTVFTSAGNDGPALSSLGAPGCLSAPITVGAYVSNAMMKAQYAMLPDDGERVADTSYTFSSRGPTPDGWLPTLCAPGGAVAPVPRHVLAGRAQYHGTSMSSPNACGVAACVLSALEDRPNPPALRRALENSCVAVPSADPFAQGFGLVDAVGAVAYLEAHAGKPAQDVAFDVTVPSFGGGRGIYLRDAGQIASPAAVGGVVVGVQVSLTSRTFLTWLPRAGSAASQSQRSRMLTAWLRPPSPGCVLARCSSFLEASALTVVIEG